MSAQTETAIKAYAPRTEGAPHPPLNERGYFRAPVFYPRFLRQVADALDAFIAFESPDPTNQEASHFIGVHGFALPVYDSDEVSEDDESATPAGWLVQYDERCWVFVPYIEELEPERES